MTSNSTTTFTTALTSDKDNPVSTKLLENETEAPSPTNNMLSPPTTMTTTMATSITVAVPTEATISNKTNTTTPQSLDPVIKLPLLVPYIAKKTPRIIGNTTNNTNDTTNGSGSTNSLISSFVPPYNGNMEITSESPTTKVITATNNDSSGSIIDVSCTNDTSHNDDKDDEEYDNEVSDIMNKNYATTSPHKPTSKAPRGYPVQLENVTTDNLKHIVVEGEGTNSTATHYIELDDNGEQVYSLKLSTLTVVNLRYLSINSDAVTLGRLTNYQYSE